MKNSSIQNDAKGGISALAILAALLVFNIRVNAQTPEFTWAKRAGGTGGNVGYSIATDGLGNSYVTGFFEGTATFGTITLTSAGDYDIFVAKYDASGNVLWAKRAGGPERDVGYGIAMDKLGNCIIAGTVKDTATFGAITLTSADQEDIFIAKYDASGSVLWAKRAGGTSDDRGYSIATDGSNNNIITGTFWGTATFGTITLITDGAYNDLFIAKYDASGNVLWAKRAGGTGGDLGYGIATDGSDNITVTGFFFEKAVFDTTMLTSAGSSDIFIAKYNASGNVLWAKRAGGIDDDYGRSITTDGLGNSIITGNFWGTATFGTTTLNSAGKYEIFVAKYDASGNVLWAKRAGGTYIDFGYGIATDKFGNSIVTGEFYGTATFDSITLTSAGSLDIFIVKYDASGNVLGAKRAGGGAEDGGLDIATDGFGNSIVTGFFEGTATFGAITLSGGGIFIAKLEEPDQFTRITTGEIVNDGGYSLGSGWGDYDNDGDLDLFVANGPSGGSDYNFLYSNNGDGTFKKITIGPIVSDIGESSNGSWGDYDNDGDLDLFVTNYDMHYSNFLYSNNGNGTFTKITTGEIVEDRGYSTSSSWGDYDNDGDLDLFVTNTNGFNNWLYSNNGDGTFAKITTGAIVSDGGFSMDCSWADYDNDSDLDLFVANGINWENNFLYSNNGDGTFTKITTGPIVSDGGPSRAGSWGDYDHDGDLDLFVARGGSSTEAQTNFLYSNNGDGTFAKITTGAIVTDKNHSQGCSWGDYDNDGDLDLFVAEGSWDTPQSNSLYSNNRDGTFTKITTGILASQIGSSRGCIWGDYDNDGDLDLFVCDEKQDNFLYSNNGNSNHWINIKCVGTVSNSSAIGAKVRVKATIKGKPVWQLNEISGQTGGGYGQNSLNAEFGLGDATVIDSIKIEWPSGIVQVLMDVGANQFLTITESADIAPNPPKNLIAIPGNQQVTLSWAPNTEPHLSHYVIYYSKQPGFTPTPGDSVARVNHPDTTYTHLGLTNGVTYYYRISAVDSSGSASEFSAEVSATPVAQIISTIPTANALHVSKGTIISVAFGININPGTINDTTFLVYGAQTGLHSGSINYSSGTKTATFDPTIDFIDGEKVTVVLTSSIKDNDGSPLTPYLWNFRIAVSHQTSGEFTDSSSFAIQSLRDIYPVDFDGDYQMELIATSFQRIHILENDGMGNLFQTGFLETGSASSPARVYCADLDRDGDMDFVVADDADPFPLRFDIVTIYLNQGNGNFVKSASYETSRRPNAIFGSDLNGDGYIDLAVANGGALGEPTEPDSILSILINRGDGTFAQTVNYVVGIGPRGIRGGDMNNDGDIDLVIVNNKSKEIVILENNGLGSFSKASQIAIQDEGLTVLVDDLNGDRFLDIAVTFGGPYLYINTNGISIFLNQGDGMFSASKSYELGNSPYKAVTADFDGDGDIDIVISSPHASELSLLINDGKADFSTRTKHSVEYLWTLSGCDFDGDGDIDLVGGGNDRILIFYNVGREILVDQIGPSITFIQAVPNPTNGAESLQLAATATDSTFGNSNVTGAEYFVGYIVNSGAGTPMSAFDGAFDSPTENVKATIDISSWGFDSKHTLFIHARDAKGNWGAFDSVLVTITALKIPDITLSNTTYNFGNVAINTSASWNFSITNAGADTLIVHDINWELPEFSVSDTAITILPSSEQKVNVTFSPKEVTSYADTLKILSNDPDEAIVKVTLVGVGVFPSQKEISVLPNPFTPNNDGYNDYVEFKYPEMYTQKPVIQLFNLRGRKVSELKNFSGNEYRWYGKDDDGRDLEPGVYIYILELNGKRISSGTITLVR